MSWMTDPGDDAYEEYDESAVRVRPNPKGSKPRTKTRPEHSDATIGRVYAVDRGRFSVLVEGTTATAPLVVERASYSSTPTTPWAAGTNSLAMPLP